MTFRRTTFVLLLVLLLEILLVGLLRWLGWYATGSAIQLGACLVATLLPLLLATMIVLRKGMKFSVRSLLLATTLVAVFLAMSLLPLVRHRAARQTSLRLLSSDATLNEGLSWEHFYKSIDLDAPPELAIESEGRLPPWLRPFAASNDSIPPDNAVRSIWLSSDAQCQVIAENWQRLPSIQSISISSGVSTEGLELLRNVLPRFPHLVIICTNDVPVPARWYASLTNVRTLYVWGEGASRGQPFDPEHLQNIAELTNLELLMVLGYAFDDNDAQTLATSTSITRVILRGTAVTATGESKLANSKRLVFRN